MGAWYHSRKWLGITVIEKPTLVTGPRVSRQLQLWMRVMPNKLMFSFLDWRFMEVIWYSRMAMRGLIENQRQDKKSESMAGRRCLIHTIVLTWHPQTWAHKKDTQKAVVISNDNEMKKSNLTWVWKEEIHSQSWVYTLLNQMKNTMFETEGKYVKQYTWNSERFLIMSVCFEFFYYENCYN